MPSSTPFLPAFNSQLPMTNKGSEWRIYKRVLGEEPHEVKSKRKRLDDERRGLDLKRHEWSALTELEELYMKEEKVKNLQLLLLRAAIRNETKGLNLKRHEWAALKELEELV